MYTFTLSLTLLAALRRLWYPSLARSETEAEEYAKILEEKVRVK